MQAEAFPLPREHNAAVKITYKLVKNYGYRNYICLYIDDLINIYFHIVHEHISLYNENAAPSLRETN